MSNRIDINCDIGEDPIALHDGTDAVLMSLITSANVACGFHAGDFTTMARCVRLARKHRVNIGAHPGYLDREHFGRKEQSLAASEIQSLIYYQISDLARCARRPIDIVHVKPHGALYHAADKEARVAQAIARGAAMWRTDLVLVGLAGSPMLEVWRDEGFRVVAEAFADRVYEPDGRLRSRALKDALITDPKEAAQQALRIVRDQMIMASDGSVLKVNAQTICIHSDTPNATHIAEAVREALVNAGITLVYLTELAC